MPLPITEKERKELRAMMPDFLEGKLGITNTHRPFRCPNPDHEDSEPSASYYPDSNIVHCFGCDKSWDIFSLVGMLYGINSFVDQAKRAAYEVGYTLGCDADVNEACELRKPRPKKEPLFPQPKEPNFHLDRDTAFKMYKTLFSSDGNTARNYLHARGIDDVCIAKHGLGFVKDPSKMIPEFCIYEPNAKGFVMIPFYDADLTSANYCIARPIGEGSVTHKEWRPKGVTATLWREWLLYEHVPVLYVTEGILDAMSLERRIQKPCVALCGTGNVSRLSSILYHMPKSQRPEKTMIAMDEDEAGHAAASKLAKSFKAIGVPHAFMPPYPNGEKDANEWHLAGFGTEWTYCTKPVGDGITPFHIIRSISNER